MTNKKSIAPWVVIGVVAVLLASAIAYLQLDRSATQNKDNDATSVNTQTTEQPTPEPATTETTKPGTYAAYSQQSFDQASESRRLLFFHANWCPQCRALEQDINAQGVPSGVAILKVDYDNSAALKQKYGVTLQTTVVEVDAQGNLLKKHVAYSQPTLAATLQGLAE